MPRNMSFYLTQLQVHMKVKTVTRRLGWDFLKPDDIVNACVKCQGLGKGGKIERICQLRIKSVEKQRLSVMCERKPWGDLEAEREGFPELSGKEFVAMFCEHMKCDMHAEVNRIEFEYV